MPTYRINGNNLTEPTQVKWILPVVKGIDGSGMKRYSPYHQFEMTWNLMSVANFNTLMTIWRGHYNSGTASATIPEPQMTDWTTGFTTYTGTFMDRPESANYNNQFHQNVKVLIRRILIP